MMVCGEKINVGDTVRIKMFISAHHFGYGEKVKIIEDYGGFYKCSNGQKEYTVLDEEIEPIKPSLLSRLIRKIKSNFTSMTKLIAIIGLCLFSLASFAQQQKKDTVVQITLSLDQYRLLIYTIDANIDSKKTSKEIIDFLQKSTQVVASKKEEKEPPKK